MIFYSVQWCKLYVSSIMLLSFDANKSFHSLNSSCNWHAILYLLLQTYLLLSSFSLLLPFLLILRKFSPSNLQIPLLLSPSFRPSFSQFFHVFRVIKLAVFIIFAKIETFLIRKHIFVNILCLNSISQRIGVCE